MDAAQNSATILSPNLDQNLCYFYFLHFLSHHQFCLIHFLLFSIPIVNATAQPLTPTTGAIKRSFYLQVLSTLVHTTHYCQIDPLKTKLYSLHSQLKNL